MNIKYATKNKRLLQASLPSFIPDAPLGTFCQLLTLYANGEISLRAVRRRFKAKFMPTWNKPIPTRKIRYNYSDRSLIPTRDKWIYQIINLVHGNNLDKDEKFKIRNEMLSRFDVDELRLLYKETLRNGLLKKCLNMIGQEPKLWDLMLITITKEYGVNSIRVLANKKKF